MARQEESLESFGFNAEEAKAAAKQNLNFLAPLAMPEVATLPMPDFYVALWAIMTQVVFETRDFSKFALGFPRGFAKTLFIKLFCLFIILFTKKKFILVVCANEAKAIEILSDIADALDSPNIQALFGNWRYQLETDKKELKKFYFNGRPVILMAVGAGTAIRGVNIKNSRPDTIIFDDVQTRECAASPAEAQKLQDWFQATAMKLKAPTGCTYFYIGNMYPDLEIKPGLYSCILRNLQNSKHWKSFIVGGILADGTSLWEDLHPIKQLQEEFEIDLAAGTPQIFCSEILNDPKGLPISTIDFQQIGKKIKIPGEQHQGNFMIIDLATDKPGADRQVINYFELFDGVPVSTYIERGNWTPSELIFRALEIALTNHCCLICVESVAYQYSMLHWFEFICAQQHITGINFEPLYTRGVAKNSRILEMFKSLMKQQILLTDKTYSPVVAEASQFNPYIKHNVDDILDTLAYAPIVMAEYSAYLVIPGTFGSEASLMLGGVPGPDAYIDQQAF